MGCHDGGARTLEQQRAQIVVALFCDMAEPGLTAAARLLGHRAKPAGKLSAVLELTRITHSGDRG
jgi:hypothetical protein